MTDRLVAVVLADDLMAADTAASAAGQSCALEIVLCGIAAERVLAECEGKGIVARVADLGSLSALLQGADIAVLHKAALLPSWSTAMTRYRDARASLMRCGEIALADNGTVRRAVFARSRAPGPVSPSVFVASWDAIDSAGATELITQPARFAARMAHAYGRSARALTADELGVVTMPRGVPVVPPAAAAVGGRAAPELVSVIVPAHNASGEIRATLDAISEQQCGAAHEIVVVDDGSTDDTSDVVARWTSTSPGARVRILRRETAGGPSAARNAALSSASGDLLVYCDADDIPEPGWLDEIITTARGADLITPIFDAASLRDTSYASLRVVAPDPSAGGTRDALARVTGNCAAWRDVVVAIGGWNERFRMAEDFDFAWRAQLAGYEIGVAREARVQYRTRTDLRSELRQVRAYAAARVNLYCEYRDAGVISWDRRLAVRRWAWLAVHAPMLARPGAARRDWLRSAAGAAGRVEGSVKERVLFL